MNFIKTVFSFHADVLKKISLNKVFFLFAALMYLTSDFVVYLQPILSQYFANSDETNGSIISILIQAILFVVLWLSYLVSASLFSVYFVRKDKSVSKLKYYLKPLVMMRVYFAYFFMVFGLLFSFFIATKFLPAVTDFISEGFRILVNKEIVSEDKLGVWLSSPTMTYAIENTAAWQVILAILSFIGVLLIVSMSFVFALPLVVKSKKNTLFASFKKSFNGNKDNFGLFVFTILGMVILKYFVPSALSLTLPPSFMEMIYENGLHYASRPIISLYDAWLFFYVIIGLEKFVLTNPKNNV